MVIQHLAKVILMKQLLIKDNQYKSKSYFSEIKDVVDCIADKTLAELEKEGVFVFPSSVRESEDLTNDQMILQSYNDMYVSGNVMGFLGVENQRLVIESRFSRGERDYFFQYLLEKILEFPNFINLETSANQDERLFSLLLFLFPRYLRLISARSITMEMSEDPLMLQDILRIIPHLLEISHIPRESIRMTIT